MFKRYASATVIEKISLAQAKKIVHAGDEAPVSFEYDPDNFTYFRCRAITANEANGNGDLFPDEHLKQSYQTFVGVGLYKDHDSDSINKAIGKVLHAEYITPSEGNPYVETICAVDKKLAPDLARRVESGIATSVSMGCFQPGTPVLLANGMQAAIEDIGPGTEIVTHSGAVSPIYAVTKSLYNGEMVDISVGGMGTISATANHPFLVLRRSDTCACGCGEKLASFASVATARNLSSKFLAGHQNKGKRGKFVKSNGSKAPEPQWVEAGDLRETDLLLSPAFGDVRYSGFTAGQMRLAGYFLAEGCFLKNKGVPSAIQFHLASWEEETLAKEIVNLLDKEFSVSAKIYRSSSHPNSITVQAYGKELASWFFKNCGQYSHLKLISDEMSASAPELQAELVAAWLNGDGHADLKRRRYSGTTVSPVLAEQIRYMCSRNGVKTRVEHHAGRNGRKDYYTVYLVGNESSRILGLTKWASSLPKRDSHMTRVGKNIVHRITSVRKRNYTGDVYNFSVKGEETYIAGGVSVHNCSVREAECGVPGCGNVAHNPQELCQHMMPGFGCKGRRNSDGSTIYEINRGIQFTELSLVTVPADPTARIFEVYAKLAERRASMSRADFIQELVKIAESADAEQMNGLRDYLDKNGLTYENAIGAKANFVADREKPVEKKDELVEQTMGLSISYIKGSSLGSSFFVARDASTTYRVAASDVLPIVVQKSIEAGDPGVVTPERLISDLTHKYASVGDFKAWAKRRRKKNRNAMGRTKCDDKSSEANAASVEPALPKTDAQKPTVENLSKEVKASESDNGRSTMDKKAEVVIEEEVANAPVAKAPANTEAEKPEDKAADVLAAFNALKLFVETKLGELQKREAVKTESNVGKSVSDGEHKDHAVNVGGKGVEDPKTESPKGHMDKGAALKVEAMDKDWSVNPKELEKVPKVPKATDNMPAVMSVDRKEMNKESVDANAGGNAGGTVKKFYNRLPSSGPGAAPMAMDAKSSRDPENEMLRKALAEEKAKVAAASEKERLQSVADKVYEVVTAMKEKNLLVDGREDAVIDTLTARFADLNQLENLKTLVAHLSIRQAAAPEADATPETELPVGHVVPQVFETVEHNEDAVLKMASIWNR